MLSEEDQKIADQFSDYRAEPGLAFYRCVLCHTAVSPWDVKDGGCPNCGGKRIAAANLSWWEKLIQVCKHPKFWEWHAVHPEH